MKVSYKDLIYLNNYVLQKKIEWKTYIDDVQLSIAKFLDLESFDGSAAQSAKRYMKEVHSYITTQIEVYLEELATKVGIYVGEYLCLDTDVLAVLDIDTINTCILNMNNLQCEIEDAEESLGIALASISDICSVPSTNFSDMIEGVGNVNNIASTLFKMINIYEEDEIKKINELEDYSCDIKTIISDIKGTDTITIDDYKLGDIKGFETYSSGFENLERSLVYTSANAYLLREAYTLIQGANEELEHISKIKEKKRKQKMHIVKGTICVITGVSCIVGAAGVAIPVVTVTSAFLTGGCWLFGTSEYYAAMEETYAIINDDADYVAFVPVRDIYFNGNQENYEEAMDIVLTSADLLSSGGKAMKFAYDNGIEEVGEYAFVSTVEYEIEKEVENQIIENAVAYSVDIFEGVTDIDVDEWAETMINSSLELCINDKSNIPLIYHK